MSLFSKLNGVRRAKRGSILMIAVLLVSSAVVRIVASVAQAENSQPNPPPLSNSAEEQLRKSAGMNATERAESGVLLRALQEREAKLEKREHQFDLRVKALQVADEEITKRLMILEQAELSLRDTLALADGAAEKDLTRLTTVYESMKPKDTAALFETMEPDFAAGFLGRMRPDVAANIMAGLSPDTAYAISVILAGRNAKVPKT